MEGGELFNRIQDRTAFNERGRINLFYTCLIAIYKSFIWFGYGSGGSVIKNGLPDSDS
jgi:hypothetical protein